MAFGRPKRHVPKPEPVGPHASANPLFQKEDEGEWSTFRQRVLISTGVTLVVAAIGFLIYGPLFQITSVSITNTRLVTPDSVQRVANEYLNGQRFLVFPNRTMWVLSSQGLEHYLQAAIAKRLSIESVVVTKERPHHLTIAINERTPVANWTDGTKIGTVDRQGVIIELRSEAEAPFPTILDENHVTFGVDSSVVKREVMTAVTTLAGELQAANFDVQDFLIPVPVCPTPIETTTNTNASTTNTNASSTSTNTSNTNAELQNANTNTSEPVIIPCDVQELRYSSPEIHIQLKDGPRVLFDRHNDLQEAVNALQRVMSQPGAQSYKQVDVRFGDRVYVK